MSEHKVYPVPAELAASAHIDLEKYQTMYQRSVDDPNGFWGDAAEEFISWFKKWDKVSEWDFNSADIKWFEGAKLNVSYNCLDRHLETRGDQPAIIWEGHKAGREIGYCHLEKLHNLPSFPFGLLHSDNLIPADVDPLTPDLAFVHAAEAAAAVVQPKKHGHEYTCIED